MRKTSLYLSDEDSELLDGLARQEHRPRAEIMREAIRAYRSPGAQQSKSSFAHAGSVNIDEPPLSELSEEELLAGFGE